MLSGIRSIPRMFGTVRVLVFLKDPMSLLNIGECVITVATRLLNRMLTLNPVWLATPLGALRCGAGPLTTP